MALITSGIDPGLARALVFGGERFAWAVLIHWRRLGARWYVQTAEHAAALPSAYQYLVSVAGGDQTLQIAPGQVSITEAERSIVLGQEWLAHAAADSAVRVRCDLYIGLPSGGSRVNLIRRGYLVPPFRFDPETHLVTVVMADGWRQILDRSEPSYVVETGQLPLAPDDSLGCPLPLPFGAFYDWPCLEIAHPPESELAAEAGPADTEVTIAAGDAARWPSAVEAWTLDGDYLYGDTTIDLLGVTVVIPSHGLLRVDLEIIAWSSATNNGGGSWTLGGISLGYAGSPVGDHASGALAYHCWIVQIGADSEAPEYAVYSARVAAVLYVERWGLYGSLARQHAEDEPCRIVRGEPWIYCISDGEVFSSAAAMEAALRVRAEDDQLNTPTDTKFTVTTDGTLVAGHDLVVARLWRGEPEIVQGGFSSASGDWTNPDGAIDNEPTSYASASFPDPTADQYLEMSAPVPAGRLLQCAVAWVRLVTDPVNVSGQVRCFVGSDPAEIGPWIPLPTLAADTWTAETLLLPLPTSHDGATSITIEVDAASALPSLAEAMRINTALIYFRVDTDAMTSPAPYGVVLTEISGIEDTDGHIVGVPGALLMTPPHVARYLLERFAGVAPALFDAAAIAAANIWYSGQVWELAGAVTAQRGLDELLAEVSASSCGCLRMGRTLIDWWTYPATAANPAWQFVRCRNGGPSNVIAASYATAGEDWLVNQLTLLYARRQYGSERREAQPWGVMGHNSRYRGGFRVAQTPTVKCPTLGRWYSQGHDIADWSAVENTVHEMILSPLWITRAESAAAMGSWILGVHGRLPWIATVRIGPEGHLLQAGDLIDLADEDLPAPRAYTDSWWTNHLRYGDAWPSPLPHWYAIVIAIRHVSDMEVEIDALEWLDPNTL